MSTYSPTVLIVDDESHVRSLLHKTLTYLECEVVGEANSGHEAVLKYHELRPDLVLLDHNMPYKTGEEALTEIVNADPRANIIILSSVTDPAGEQRCLRIGAKAFMRKDQPLEKIMDTIKAALEKIREKAETDAADDRQE
jgi:DNA-binding NarL/FixJ family response regulator